MDHPLIHP